MPILLNNLQYIKCQELFLRFAIKLGQPLPVNSNPVNVLLTHKDAISKESELIDFVYQTAMEAAFHKKRFPNQDLLDIFNNKFKIMDPYHINNDLSDMSTVNSMLVFEKIKQQGYFTNIPITIFSTPLEYHTPLYYVRQNSSAKKYTEDSKAVTDNTNADARIAHRIYDIKHSTTHTSTTKNHLYPWTYEQIQSNIKNHLNSLLDNLSWPDKNTSWNNIIEKNFSLIPENYALPIVIQMTNSPYTPKCDKSLLDKVRLSPDSLNDHFKARRAIAGVCASFGIQHLKNAVFATDGAISMDILSKTEEVD